MQRASGNQKEKTPAPGAWSGGRPAFVTQASHKGERTVNRGKSRRFVSL
jgi:hypothetical protein